MEDSFRISHPELKRYTWRKKNPVKQARLDYFLTSNYLSPFIHNIKFENSYRSDHSPVVLYCRLTELKKGRGFWKFNNSLLTYIDYVQFIKQKINTIKKQYAALVYDIENIESISNADIFFRIKDHIFLDTLLMEIRGKTISYATFKNKLQNETEKKLENEIKLLEQHADNESVKLIEEKQTELKNIRNHKLRGNYIRSRVKWIEEGEKPSKYFCNLESRNYLNKTIKKLD